MASGRSNCTESPYGGSHQDDRRHFRGKMGMRSAYGFRTNAYESAPLCVCAAHIFAEGRRGKLPIGSVPPTGWLPCWKPPAVPRAAQKRPDFSRTHPPASKDGQDRNPTPLAASAHILPSFTQGGIARSRLCWLLGDSLHTPAAVRASTGLPSRHRGILPGAPSWVAVAPGPSQPR
jgi:hypothetical protein